MSSRKQKRQARVVGGVKGPESSDLVVSDCVPGACYALSSLKAVMPIVLLFMSLSACCSALCSVQRRESRVLDVALHCAWPIAWCCAASN